MNNTASNKFGTSQTFVTPIRGWREPDRWDNSDPQRLGPPIFRKNTHIRPYVRLAKVEEKREQPDPLVTITETLGALNTVGSYIVNMTRGVENSNYPPKELPSAIYTISKNILGKILIKFKSSFSKICESCIVQLLFLFRTQCNR